MTLTSTGTEDTDLVEAVVDGAVDAAGFAALHRLLTDTARRRGGVRVLVEVRRLDGVGLGALREDLRSWDLLQVLRRYAVVTSSAPLRLAAKGAFAVLPVEGRVFADRAEALAWLAVGGGV